MHSPPGGAMVSTRMRPRAFGIDALCSRRGVRALRAASGLVGWRGSDRDPISSTWVARLQKPNFDVLLWAKVASGGLTTAEGSARMISPRRGKMQCLEQVGPHYTPVHTQWSEYGPGAQLVSSRIGSQTLLRVISRLRKGCPVCRTPSA